MVRVTDAVVHGLSSSIVVSTSQVSHPPVERRYVTTTMRHYPFRRGLNAFRIPDGRAEDGAFLTIR